MTDAKAWLDSTKLPEAMTAAVKAVIIERPDDPVKRVGELLIAASAKVRHLMGGITGSL